MVSRKRTATSSTPLTPRSKRARLDHDEMEANGNNYESTSMKPPSTVAPLRVLAEPSSPCGGRADRTMQAPPKPAMEEFFHMSSPTRNPSTGKSRKPVHERQTPVRTLEPFCLKRKRLTLTPLYRSISSASGVIRTCLAIMNFFQATVNEPLHRLAQLLRLSRDMQTRTRLSWSRREENTKPQKVTLSGQILER